MGESPRRPVEGLLDRQHLRIARRLLQEQLHARGERVVGVVQQDVALADHGQHVRGGRRLDLAERARRTGHELALLEVVALQAVDRPQAGEVQRAGQAEHLELVDAELADQQLEDVGVDRLLDLEADRRPEPAAHELALEGLQQVLGVVLLDLDVLVARDAEGVGLLDLHAREQRVEVRGDDVLERHEPGRRHLDEPGQQGRHLDAGEQLGPGDRVAHDDGQVQRQAADVRERVRGVDGQRRQDGEDLRVEEQLDLGLLRRGELVPPQELDALGLQVREAPPGGTGRPARAAARRPAARCCRAPRAGCSRSRPAPRCPWRCGA